ncbi:hypothetical protein ACIQV2_22790 [Streptomyces globosus]
MASARPNRCLVNGSRELLESNDPNCEGRVSPGGPLAWAVTG